ncbi:serine O-acetyltransferase [Sinimarinibacterium flocculans]|uniref:Serine acetyltransferase n=1 Tax=Sinimarinibacterium flocculans TaxID=985250 RepID=A0A318E9Z3_9GAMM|nr:serine O-acetyltransferase [Sinimarinibacterium flocculans]PXV66209.1 serine O-acetyltransferase [Sinimarinibacterium flocculans]
MFDRIREDIRSIRERDPAAQSWWEVVTCYPGLHAIWGHRISHALWMRGFKWLARFNSHLARWLTGIEIHPGARLGRRVFIDHGLGVVIGETAEVGDDCTIYQGVTLGGTSLTRGAKRHPTLGSNVVVGAGAKVLGPFTVGAGANIGSNAVVVRAVPDGATAVGIPARVVGVDAQRKTEFHAYGLTDEGMPDPVAKAIAKILEHVQTQDEQLTRMCKVVRALDSRMPELELGRLELPDFCRDDAEAGERADTKARAGLD